MFNPTFHVLPKCPTTSANAALNTAFTTVVDGFVKCDEGNASAVFYIRKTALVAVTERAAYRLTMRERGSRRASRSHRRRHGISQPEDHDGLCIGHELLPATDQCCARGFVERTGPRPCERDGSGDYRNELNTFGTARLNCVAASHVRCIARPASIMSSRVSSVARDVTTHKCGDQRAGM